MKILVCGDAMSDVYMTCSVTRISPEGPVPVYKSESTETRQGAAANVANNIEAMGIPCERLFGAGKRIEKVRLISKGQHCGRIDFDYPQTPIPCDQTFQDALGRCQIVVLVDYGKGSLANVAALIAAAKASGAQVLVDPKGDDYSKYRGANLIKPNREEMRELIGNWSSQDELDFRARQFLLTSGIESILLTQAGDGMTLYTKADTKHLPSEVVKMVDVSGAGEAALSAYAAALAKDLDPLPYASKAAALCCERFGTTVLTKEEVFGAG